MGTISREQMDLCDISRNLTVDGFVSRLNDILNGFEKVSRKRNKFMKDFPRWSKDRKQLIEEMRRIAEELNEHKLNVNIATATGSAVGIGGGITLAVSAVSAVAFPPAGIFLLIGGLVAGGLGALTSIGSAVAGQVLNKINVDKVKTMLEQDEQKYNHLKKWIQCSQVLKEAIAEVMSLDVFKELKEAFSSIFGDLFNCTRGKTMNLNGMWKMIQSMGPEQLLRRLRKFLSKFVSLKDIGILVNICQNKDLFNSLCILLKYQDVNPLAFEGVVMKYKLSTLAACGSRLGIGGLTAAVASRQALKIAIARGMLSAAAIALDTIILIQAAIQIHKKSPSKYAVKIKQTADLMAEELSAFTEMYEEAQNTTTWSSPSFELSFRFE